MRAKQDASPNAARAALSRDALVLSSYWCLRQKNRLTSSIELQLDGNSTVEGFPTVCQPSQIPVNLPCLVGCHWVAKTTSVHNVLADWRDGMIGWRLLHATA
jgi:hypothetical protein